MSKTNQKNPHSGSEIGTEGVVEPGRWLQHTHVHDHPPEVPWQATLPAAGRSSMCAETLCAALLLT